MKYAVALLSLGALLTITGCQNPNLTDSSKEYYLTRQEISAQQSRKESMELYKTYLKDMGELITDQPFDVVQQMVYSTIPEKKEVYTVNLYKQIQPIENPSYVEVMNKSPHLQHIGVTKDSELPEQIINNLQYGYYGIELDGMPYILEVLHEEVDLSEWEASYSKMLEVETQEE